MRARIPPSAAASRSRRALPRAVRCSWPTAARRAPSAAARPEACRETSSCSCGPHFHFHRADLLDACGDDVVRLDRADAFGRAGEDDVARIERVKRRGVLDQLRHAEDEISGVRALTPLAVDRYPEIELARVGNLVP